MEHRKVRISTYIEPVLLKAFLVGTPPVFWMIFTSFCGAVRAYLQAPSSWQRLQQNIYLIACFQLNTGEDNKPKIPLQKGFTTYTFFSHKFNDSLKKQNSTNTYYELRH